MRFDIDYARAKSMATRLQAFLAQNPKPKLSRSSAIEATAQMLGYNNRNEMAARLDQSAQTASAETSPLQAAHEALERLLAVEMAAQAQAIAALARVTAPEANFHEAIHADTDDGSYVLSQCEQTLAASLDADPIRLAMLRATGLDVDRDGRSDEASLYAKALTDKSLTCAEEIWQDLETPEAQEPAIPGDKLAEAIEIIIAAQEARENPDKAIAHAARKLTVPGGEPYGRIYADIRKGFIATHGGLPEDLTRFCVKTICWFKGSSLVELSGDRVGEISGEALATAQIEICAIDRKAALTRARRLLSDADAAPRLRSLWTPLPELGVRNLHWASQAREGDLDTYIKRNCALVEDHWEYDLSEILDPTIDDIAPTEGA